MFSNIQTTIDVQKITTLIISYIPNLVSAMLLFFLFWLANKIVQKALTATLTRAKIERQAINLLLRGAKTGIYIFAILTIADQLQINIKSLLAGVGVMGLALSFAAKDTVGNIISGIVIIIDRPFREGDWIALGTLQATVTQIRLRTTVLTTFDNETVVVPNQRMSQERIINYTITPRIRVKIPVGIAYKENIDTARAILLELPKNDDRILTEPPPVVVVTNLDASSVNLQLRFWIENPAQQASFLFEYTEKSKKALDTAGIEIPFPHLQVFVENTEGIKLLASSSIALPKQLEG
ncbi:mechanosensitive ion channel [Desulfobacula sp.]|uniref:mechanosensitive ion channel family protein n=1 Tax=Desulfobacula sp. TaxID=2593537 RepID=UPI0026162B04|nr:mechanosensitive ion channel [Desulfobacula sp.]